jgi:hypothetical protein
MGLPMLTADTLGALLASGLQWSAADAEGYLAALQARGLLPAADRPLQAAHAVRKLRIPPKGRQVDAPSPGLLQTCEGAICAG